MSRKDGVLALLVVVVWGLNFVVIKVGLHNMPPLMLAGLRFMLVAFPAIFCRTTESTTEFAAGVWINHQFCAVCFSFVPLTSVCLLDWLRWCYRHRRFTIVLGAFTFGERLHGKQLAGIALAILAYWC